MRNALICISVMLALVLAWQSFFDGKAGDAADQVLAKALDTKLEHEKLKPAAVSLSMLIPPAAAKPVPCDRSYARAVRECGIDASCRMAASDHYDLCQATGMWPN